MYIEVFNENSLQKFFENVSSPKLLNKRINNTSAKMIT